jgi:hypothetical protein
LFCLANLIFEALKSAWHDSYLGNNHRLLFANINAIPPTEKPYSNQIAIVQSSGTGKSRMVHEQANVVFTIPFNLRKSVEKQGLCFLFSISLGASDVRTQTWRSPSLTMLFATTSSKLLYRMNKTS